MMMAAGPGADAPAAVVEEKTTFDLVLEEFDATKKVATYKAVRNICGIAVNQVKDYTSALPKVCGWLGQRGRSVAVTRWGWGWVSPTPPWEGGNHQSRRATTASPLGPPRHSFTHPVHNCCPLSHSRPLALPPRRPCSGAPLPSSPAHSFTRALRYTHPLPPACSCADPPRGREQGRRTEGARRAARVRRQGKDRVNEACLARTCTAVDRAPGSSRLGAGALGGGVPLIFLF